MPWWKVLWKYSSFEAADSGWSLIVVSTYFGTFLQVVLGRPAAQFGWAVTAASLAVALISPFLGATADARGRRQPFLRIAVMSAVIFTAALGFTGTAWSAFASFIFAYISVNAGFTLFTAMLPAVSAAGNVATIVSMTVGIGYVGALFCITVLGRYVASDADVAHVFLPMAVVYGLLTVPAMFLSPDFRAQATTRFDLGMPYRRLRETFREARTYRYLFRFLVGDFFYENAVASVITLMGLYARNVMGFSAGELKTIFGPAIVIAALSAWLLFRPLVKTLGPKRSVLIVLGIWLALFAAILAIGPETTLRISSFMLPARTIFTFLVAPLAGLGLAGVWSTSRVLLTALTPVGKSGEFWGLYNLSGRTASVLGDATWATILSIFGEGLMGYHAAVIALALYVLLGAGFIFTLPDVRPSRENFLDPVIPNL